MSRLFLLVVLLGLCCARAVAIEPGQLDTFQDGSTMGWQVGPGQGTPPDNPHPVVSVPTGGPSGAGDAYIERFSSGELGAGGRMLVFNEQQWAGDYVSAGVSAIRADMINLGTTPLAMRVIVYSISGFSGIWVSSTPIVLNPGSGWQAVEFDITEASMTRSTPTGTYDQTFVRVSALRLVSKEALGGNDSTSGDRIEGKLGVDNIQAVGPVGVEASTWGAVKSLHR